jgi:hypothetical protein
MAPFTLNPLQIITEYRLCRKLKTQRQITRSTFALIDSVGGWDTLDPHDQAQISNHGDILLDIAASLKHRRSLKTGCIAVTEAIHLYEIVKSVRFRGQCNSSRAQALFSGNRRGPKPTGSVPALFVAASQLNGGIYANVRSGCLRGCYR